MSARLVGDALWLGCSPTEMAVLAIIADQCDDDGVGCFYKVATIADRTGMTERGVQKVLRRLEERQLLTAVAHANSSNDWIINVDMLRSIADTARDAARQKGRVGAARPSRRPRGERSSPTEGVNVVRGRGERSSPYSSKDSNTPLTPLSAKAPRRRKRREEPAVVEPIVTSKPNEGWEATEFRRLSAERLGDGPYRNLIQPCHLARVGDDLVLQAPSETLRECLAPHRSRLGPIVRQVGCVALRVEVTPSGKRPAPDPKVADAARQLEAIRGGRVAGAALPTGGLGRG